MTTTFTFKGGANVQLVEAEKKTTGASSTLKMFTVSPTGDAPTVTWDITSKIPSGYKCIGLASGEATNVIVNNVYTGAETAARIKLYFSSATSVKAVWIGGRGSSNYDVKATGYEGTSTAYYKLKATLICVPDTQSDEPIEEIVEEP